MTISTAIIFAVVAIGVLAVEVALEGLSTRLVPEVLCERFDSIGDILVNLREPEELLDVVHPCLLLWLLRT